MPMGSLYQLLGPILGPGPGFASFPIDGKDKDRIPDDGFQIGVKNTSTEPVTVRASAMCYDRRSASRRATARQGGRAP